MRRDFESARTIALAMAAICLLCAGCGRKPSHGASWAAAVEVTDQPMDGQISPYAVVPDAHQTIGRKMPQFRRCFERFQSAGKVHLVLTINGDGSVRRAKALGNVPRDVIRCIEGRAKQAQFSPPKGGDLAQLDVPVALYDQ